MILLGDGLYVAVSADRACFGDWRRLASHPSPNLRMVLQIHWVSSDGELMFPATRRIKKELADMFCMHCFRGNFNVGSVLNDNSLSEKRSRNLIEHISVVSKVVVVRLTHGTTVIVQLLTLKICQDFILT